MTDTAKGMPLSKLAMNPPVTFEIRIKPMTNTAKPTLGPWYFCPYPAGNGGFVYAGGPGGPSICDMSQYELPEQNGEFIAEAGTVYHETSLTPRQLLERVRELKAALTEIATSRFCDYEMTKSDIYEGGYGIGVTDGHRYCANIAEATLAKHGEGV